MTLFVTFAKAVSGLATLAGDPRARSASSQREPAAPRCSRRSASTPMGRSGDW